MKCGDGNVRSVCADEPLGPAPPNTRCLVESAVLPAPALDDPVAESLPPAARTKQLSAAAAAVHAAALAQPLSTPTPVLPFSSPLAPFPSPPLPPARPVHGGAAADVATGAATTSAHKRHPQLAPHRRSQEASKTMWSLAAPPPLPPGVEGATPRPNVEVTWKRDGSVAHPMRLLTHTRVTGCTDDTSYMEGGWSCGDWDGYDCSTATVSYGVDGDLLQRSCPRSCGSCHPPSPPLPRISPPPPPPLYHLHPPCRPCRPLRRLSRLRCRCRPNLLHRPPRRPSLPGSRSPPPQRSAPASARATRPSSCRLAPSTSSAARRSPSPPARP